MLPVVPAGILRTNVSFSHNVYADFRQGKHGLRASRTGREFGDYNIGREINGTLEDGFVYTLIFRDCQDNWMTNIEVKKIKVSISSGEQTVVKECGRTVIAHMDNRREFVFEKEEAALLLTENGSRLKKLRVDGKVFVENTYGIRSVRNLSFDFSIVNAQSSLAFSFSDDKILYANATLLSIHSYYFQRLFQNMEDLPKDEKTNLPLVNLRDFPSSAFEEILRLVYPSIENDPSPSKEIVPEVLRLADFLSFDFVLIRYEKWLEKDCRNQHASIMEKLIWSSQYSMAILQEQAIRQLKSASQVNQLHKDRRFRDLPKEVTTRLLGRLLEITGHNIDEDIIDDDIDFPFYQSE